MRVIAGTARSLRLKTPAGKETRPTTDRIKETLFNMLQNELTDCIFADLFCGGGGIGIEALSRGAKKALFVEQNKEAAVCLMDNLKFTRLDDCAVLYQHDVLTALQSISEKKIDIIYMDPPYDKEYEQKVLALLRDKPYVTTHTLFIVEAKNTADFSFAKEQGYEIIKIKYYKTNKHVFLRVDESRGDAK